jgi:hypothetical protein
MSVNAVLDLGALRMVDTEEYLLFFRDADISLMCLNAEQKQKLFQYLCNYYKNKKESNVI